MSDEIDGPALSAALDAFVEAYGHGITWREVLPLVMEASGLDENDRAVEIMQMGDGDLAALGCVVPLGRDGEMAIREIAKRHLADQLFGDRKRSERESSEREDQ